MNANITPWGVIWLIVALLGLIAVILGNTHHFITVIIGTLMMIINRQEEDNQSNLT